MILFCVAPLYCLTLCQNDFPGNLNAAPEVQGAGFLSVLYPVCLVREM